MKTRFTISSRHSFHLRLQKKKKPHTKKRVDSVAFKFHDISFSVILSSSHRISQPLFIPFRLDNHIDCSLNGWTTIIITRFTNANLFVILFACLHFHTIKQKLTSHRCLSRSFYTEKIKKKCTLDHTPIQTFIKTNYKEPQIDVAYLRFDIWKKKKHEFRLIYFRSCISKCINWIGYALKMK